MFFNCLNFKKNHIISVGDINALLKLLVFMPPKELWEAYSNRTVRPSVPLSCPVNISYIL